VKLLKRETLKEYIDPSNQLEEWGGTDNYVYTFEPEIRKTKETTLGSTLTTLVPNGCVLSSNSRPRKVGLFPYSYEKFTFLNYVIHFPDKYKQE